MGMCNQIPIIVHKIMGKWNWKRLSGASLKCYYFALQGPGRAFRAGEIILHCFWEDTASRSYEFSY